MSKRDPLNPINILTNRIRANEADYNLNRQTAKISALASGDLGKILIFNWRRFKL